MIQQHELMPEIVVTIDTREKDSARINSIRDFFTLRGAMVTIDTLDHVDYRIEGFYHGKQVDYGIEFKRGDDFSTSFTELNNRLALACGKYERVGIIVQHNHKKIVDMMYDTYEHAMFEYHIYVKNTMLTHHVPYSTMKNTLRAYSEDGIICNEINSVFEFPRAVVSDLNFIVNEHKGLYLSKDNSRSEFRNMLIRIPGIGPHKSDRIAAAYGCMREVLEADRKEVEKIIGKAHYTKLMQFIGY